MRLSMIVCTWRQDGLARCQGTGGGAIGDGKELMTEPEMGKSVQNPKPSFLEEDKRARTNVQNGLVFFFRISKKKKP